MDKEGDPILPCNINEEKMQIVILQNKLLQRDKEISEMKMQIDFYKERDEMLVQLNDCQVQINAYEVSLEECQSKYNGLMTRYTEVADKINSYQNPLLCSEIPGSATTGLLNEFKTDMQDMTRSITNPILPRGLREDQIQILALQNNFLWKDDEISALKNQLNEMKMQIDFYKERDDLFVQLNDCQVQINAYKVKLNDCQSEYNSLKTRFTEVDEKIKSNGNPLLCPEIHGQNTSSITGLLSEFNTDMQDMTGSILNPHCSPRLSHK